MPSDAARAADAPIGADGERRRATPEPPPTAPGLGPPPPTRAAAAEPDTKGPFGWAPGDVSRIPPAETDVELDAPAPDRPRRRLTNGIVFGVLAAAAVVLVVVGLNAMGKQAATPAAPTSTATTPAAPTQTAAAPIPETTSKIDEPAPDTTKTPPTDTTGTSKTAPEGRPTTEPRRNAPWPRPAQHPPPPQPERPKPAPTDDAFRPHGI